ncbi:TPA: hypothetical protein ACPZN0_002442 [Yersinia enterocolitica]|uniref:hypothetical protein n=1 Tax=Yersinia proxima TaxID=2890316 RepID=UPI001D105375|nr:hypothetical protein [Yersinia proxima]HDL6746953.1 hypothetical protein [Yersinia enterocolitica]HDL8093419.1 hypothetical protein [Yersinia enterocolitica]HDL8480806.1 hypothetical protein [Yersinia enterocolitica]HDM8338992.1 hypothetical protein [Yersinia enterocolitica]HDU2646366.1 hypothetical protein [Yersinia enterocolitica]
MATHINTTNAIKGLTCVTEHLKALEVLFIGPDLARHSIQHLTTAGIEICRLNSEAIKLRSEIAKLKAEQPSLFVRRWESVIDAVSATTAGERVSSVGIFDPDMETDRAIAALKKTEADRKEALRTAEAFQKAQPKAEPVGDIFEIVSREILSGFFPQPHTLNFSILARNFTQEHDSRARYKPTSTEIIDEAIRASSIHPDWPTDALHAVSILTEEAGELMKATIEYHYNNGDKEAIRQEAIQTAAMALRVLLNIDKYKRPSDEK